MFAKISQLERASVYQLILVLALVGCTQGTSNPVRSHAPQAAATVSPVDGSPRSEVSEVTLDKLFADLDDSEIRISDHFIRQFEKANNSLLERTQSASGEERVALLTQLAQYKNKILDGCASESLDACLYLDTFRRVPLMADVVYQLAVVENDEAVKLRLLKLHFVLANSVVNPNAVILLNRTARSYLESIVGEKSSNQQKRQLLELVSIKTMLLSPTDKEKFRNELRSLQEQWSQWLTSNSQYAGSLKSINDWSSQNLTDQEIEQRFLREFKAETVAEDGFINALEKLKVRAQENQLDTTRWHHRDLDLVELQKNKELAMAFILVNQLYRNTPSEKVEPLRGQTSEQAILKVAQWYLQVRLLSQTYDTAQVMASLFKKFRVEGGSRESLLSSLVKEARISATPVWKNYFKNVKNIESFFTHRIEFQQRETSSEIKSFRKYLNELNPTVKYLNTYTAMIMLGFYASKFDYAEQFKIFDQKFDIDARTVIRSILNGTLSPFFIFTDYDQDTQALDEAGVTLSLLYLIELNLHADYGITPEEMSEVLTKSAINIDLERLQKGQQQLTLAREPNGATTRMLKICSDLTKGQTIEVDVSMRDVLRRAFMGLVGDPFATQPMGAAQVLWTDFRENSALEYLEIIRSDLKPQLARVQLWENKTIGKASARVAMALESASTVERMIKEDIEPMTECFLKVQEMELKNRFLAWNAEKRFLLAVENALNQLAEAAKSRSDNEVEKLRSELNTQLAQQGGIDRFGKENTEFWTEYQSFGGLQRDPSGGFVFRYRASELAIRLMHYMDHRNNSESQIAYKFTIPTSTREIRKQMDIAYNEQIPTENLKAGKIVQSALEPFHRWTRWFDDKGTSNTPLRYLLYTLTSVLRFEMENNPDRMQEAQQISARFNKLLDLSVRALNLVRLSPQEIDFINNDWQQNHLLTMLGVECIFTRTTLPLQWGGVADEIFAALVSFSLGKKPNMRSYRSVDEMLSGRNRSTNENTPSEELLTPRYSVFEKADKYYRTLMAADEKLIVPLKEEDKTFLSHLLVQPIIVQIKLAKQFLEVVDERKKAGWNDTPIQLVLGESVLTNPYFVSFSGQYSYDMSKFHQRTENYFLRSAQ